MPTPFSEPSAPPAAPSPMESTRLSAFARRFGSSFWLLALLALWLLVTLGLRPLMVPDEGRYAGIARDMVSGDWLVPRLNGLPFFHKPPLFYWIDMAAMQLLGANSFSARIAPMVGAWLMGASLLLALRPWHGHRVALMALGLLATCPFYFVGAQYANHDMLVAGLITVAVFAFARGVESTRRVHLGWVVLGWAACALATLSKGLIGIVLPALVIGPWLLARGRFRQMRGVLHPLGLLVFVALAAPWFVAMQLRFSGFFDYFFVEQHFRRFAQTNFNNQHPFWFFLVAMPALTLPWSLWLPQALRRAWVARDERSLFYLWWIVAVVGFFSLPSSKLVGYVLPATAPLCALLALAIGAGRERVWLGVMALAAPLCVALVVALAWRAPKSNLGAAMALAQRIGPADRVVMVDAYFSDLPFYAGLREPVLVASDWDDPALPARDNWRKELFDAARFDPPRGAALLRPRDRLDALLCDQATVWFVTGPHAAAQVSVLAGATLAFADAQTELWRAPGRPCPG